MGNKKGKKKQEVKKQKEKNQKIEEMMQREQNNLESEIMLLVLGTGDSGKSTFVKQAQLLYKNGFSEKECDRFKKAIRKNLIIHMKLLIRGSYDFGLELKRSNERRARKFLDIDDRSGLSEKTIISIKKLWKDSTLKEVFEKRVNLQIPDTADYFLDSLERIAEENYSPTNQDIINCRIPTTGINELQFQVSGYPWRIVDVGGQRSERRKWIHHFKHATIVLFVVAISEYDQYLFEDQNINRMFESLELFHNIAKKGTFVKTDFILIFNKMDLLKKKIKKSTPKICFKDYKGGHHASEAKKFITRKFLKVGKSKKRKVYPMYTSATNNLTIQNTFDKIINTVADNLM
ncbi:guanine nucleotide-binding protein g(o) subunit alpha [Anaeramoeba flamelloides]|uniref:Guanine nucleotide-binding protein g(O) subunit alpha n=1 Tax=Anaeramoeba flamelloides TaxID=1746091 RepID=A0ABQ8X8Y0_9EUKA|nr:guanine nucleotide-binding protein g(o) subunit alpha [Anaeramoeba flamelloides]